MIARVEHHADHFRADIHEHCLIILQLRSSSSSSTTSSTSSSTNSTTTPSTTTDQEDMGLSQEEKKECLYCSEKMRKDENTCPNCGQTLFEKDEGRKVETEKDLEKNNTFESAQGYSSSRGDRALEKISEQTRYLSDPYSNSKTQKNESETKVRCLECGVMNDDDNSYCINCGSELQK